MNVLFASYMDLTGPGVMHLYHFANELQRQGHRAMLVLNGTLDSVRLMDEPPAFEIVEARFGSSGLDARLLARARRFAPQVIHCWTPRNTPARIGLEVKAATRARLMVHYEDDEEYIYDFHGGDLLTDFDKFVASVRNPPAWVWTQPVVSYIANHFADSFTAISKPLLDRLDTEWNKPVHLLYPGVDLDRFSPTVDGQPIRARLGLQDRRVVLYSGSVAPMHEFDLMLEGFARLAARDQGAFLIHLGRILEPEAVREQIRRLGLARRCMLVGHVAHRDVHNYLAAADVLVQSGRPGLYNEFRLPSKLPEYLAMGRPVVTFSAGIGRDLEDGVEVVKTYTGDADELAAAMQTVLDDPGLASRLGTNGRRRAEALFNWSRNTAQLVEFYAHILSQPAIKAVSPGRLPPPGRQTSASSRRVLAVAGHAAAIELCHSVAGELSARGHDVSVLAPTAPSQLRAKNRSSDADLIASWRPDTLNACVSSLAPDVLLFVGCQAASHYDPLSSTPAAMFLDGDGCSSDSVDAVDFFVCAEGQSEEMRRWLRERAPDLRASDVGEGIEALDRFCRWPRRRRSPDRGRPPQSVAHWDDKTAGMLVDEAIRHFRRGGVVTLVAETCRFLARRVRRHGPHTGL